VAKKPAEIKKPLFVRKRDAKAAEKAEKPTKVDGAPKNFMMKAKSAPIAAKKPIKSIFGLFGGENPFVKKPSKVNKTLIATPSKFEIRNEPKRGKSRSSKSAAEAKAIGIRGKLKKVAAAKKIEKKAPIVAKTSKKIDKVKAKAILLKAKALKAKKTKKVAPKKKPDAKKIKLVKKILLRKKDKKDKIAAKKDD